MFCEHVEYNEFWNIVFQIAALKIDTRIVDAPINNEYSISCIYNYSDNYEGVELSNFSIDISNGYVPKKIWHKEGKITEKWLQGVKTKAEAYIEKIL